jgi:hypothetical protein
MKTTELVAWIGATTGIVSLGWNIYTKITANRPKPVVKAYANMVQMPPPPKNSRFLRITVQNIGTAPATITNVEFYKLIPRWKRLLCRLHLKKRGEEIHAIMNDYRGAQIPHKLEVGSEWVALMEQDGGFEDWLNTDRLHCAIHHSFSRRPVPTKIIRGPIKAVKEEQRVPPSLVR